MKAKPTPPSLSRMPSSAKRGSSSKAKSNSPQRPRSASSAHSDRSRSDSDRPRAARPYGERSRSESEQPRATRPYGERSRSSSEQPRETRSYGERARPARPYSDSELPRSAHPYIEAERAHAFRPRPDTRVAESAKEEPANVPASPAALRPRLVKKELVSKKLGGEDQGWQNVSEWYDQCVGSSGHFYHRELILPKLAPLLQNAKSLLDLGCGQGVLERLIESSLPYTGVDASQTLLKSAKEQSNQSHHQFILGDLNAPIEAIEGKFDLAIFLLSLQNIAQPAVAIQTAASHLTPEGKLAIVINHPCFRIPRQSDWSEEPTRKILTRRLFSYLSPLAVPIQAHPGKAATGKSVKGQNEQSISYHHSLTDLFSFIEKAKLKIEHLEEWSSPKSSTGTKARMENRAREEFPLFLYILASK